MIHRIWQQKGILPSVLLKLRNSTDQSDKWEYRFLMASERVEMEPMDKGTN